MPAFIDIGQSLEIGAESDALKAFHTAGFLGTEHGPFFIADPRDASVAVRPPKQMTPERFERRYERYKKLLEASPAPGADRTSDQQGSLHTYTAVDPNNRFGSAVFSHTASPKPA